VSGPTNCPISACGAFTCARCPAVAVTLDAGGAGTDTQGHPRT
jgi:hypothetical protein